MFGPVPQNAAPFLGTRPNISESHSEISTQVPFCIAAGRYAATPWRVCGAQDTYKFWHVLPDGGLTARPEGASGGGEAAVWVLEAFQARPAFAYSPYSPSLQSFHARRERVAPLPPCRLLAQPCEEPHHSGWACA